jgi:hypothetical protein
MSVIKVNNITNRDGTSGPVIAGIATVSTTSHMVVPTGRTGTRYADGGENIVKDGLVANLDTAYGYNESDPYYLYDLSGNENNANLINGPTYSTSNGGYFSYDGSNDYARIQYSPQIIPINQISFEAFAYLSDWDIATDCRVLSATQGGGWQIGLNESGYITSGYFGIMIYISQLGDYTTLRVARSSISSGWHHICGTFDGRYATMYIDGTQSVQNDLGGIKTISYSYDSPVLIGGELADAGSVSGQYWPGYIGPVKIYNKGLSATEVLQNYNALKSRFGL